MEGALLQSPSSQLLLWNPFMPLRAHKRHPESSFAYCWYFLDTFCSIFNLASDPIGFSHDLCLGRSGEVPFVYPFFVTVVSLFHDTGE